MFPLCINLEEEGLILLGVIQSASAGGAPWEVLLNMAGTSDFGTAYPCVLFLPDLVLAATGRPQTCFTGEV